MADVGAAKVSDTAALAPVSCDFLFSHAEGTVILRHVADTAQSQAGNTAQLLGDVKEKTVDGVKVLGNLLHQNHMAGQVRHQVGAAQHGQRHQVECDNGPLVQPGLQRHLFAAEKAQHPANGILPALTPDIACQRAVDGFADATTVKRSQQGACIGIAKVGLASGRLRQSGHGRRGNAAGTVSAHGKPHCVNVWIVGSRKKCGKARRIIACKMSMFFKTLGGEVQFDVRKFRFRQRQHGLCPITADRFSGTNAGNSGRHYPFPLTSASQSAMGRIVTSPMNDSPGKGSYFFCGIGGSGMLPLAQIVKGLGAEVGGSDRSFDQGRTPEKFAWLERHGFKLFPQDGSGLTSWDQVLVASAAIEDTVPEVIRARSLGCPRLTRAELLSKLFNAAPVSLAVGGTSGKSTTTAMLGWIMEHTGHSPTIMNGAVMKNFAAPENPFASAVVGHSDVFVSEVDESDGSIALYNPTVAVLLNISLDHKSMEELRRLFGEFLRRAKVAVANLDDDDVEFLSRRCKNVVSFAIDNKNATLGLEPGTIVETETETDAILIDRREDVGHSLRLPMPGRHNLENALAAIAAAVAAGVSVHDAATALASFKGLARRFDVIGTSQRGVTVIDDFGHNPEKARATLRTLKAQEGRVIAFFQPHGYGPLRQMGTELANTFAEELGPDDLTIMCEPVYFGGTVDRSEGSERIVKLINDAGGNAEYIEAREGCGDRIVEIARAGDRVAVMGARDDTLTSFAESLLQRL